MTSSKSAAPPTTNNTIHAMIQDIFEVKINYCPYNGGLGGGEYPKRLRLDADFLLVVTCGVGLYRPLRLHALPPLEPAECSAADQYRGGE